MLVSSLLSTVPAYSVCTAALRAPDAGVCLRLLLLAPLLEEWVVRAGLQEWLIRRTAAVHGGAAPAMSLGAIVPVFGSASAFGLLHLASGWPAALAVTAPGLLLAVLYQHTRDWRLCAASHSLLNVSAIFMCAA
jgi:membrane protease YdiL (CAAX protease family)